MIAFLLTVIWVMPGIADVKPEITQYELQGNWDDCNKAGMAHAKELWEKHQKTGSMRFLCVNKDEAP